MHRCYAGLCRILSFARPQRRLHSLLLHLSISASCCRHDCHIWSHCSSAVEPSSDWRNGRVCLVILICQTSVVRRRHYPFDSGTVNAVYGRPASPPGGEEANRADAGCCRSAVRSRLVPVFHPSRLSIVTRRERQRGDDRQQQHAGVGCHAAARRLCELLRQSNYLLFHERQLSTTPVSHDDQRIRPLLLLLLLLCQVSQVGDRSRRRRQTATS
jgi:hypothetical protein